MTADEPAPTPFPTTEALWYTEPRLFEAEGRPGGDDYLFEQWSHGVFDDYWKQPGLHAEGFYDRYADVPIVHLSGWYDPYARTAAENFLGLSRGKKEPAATDPRSLDPW